MSKRYLSGAFALALTLVSPAAGAAGLWPLSYTQRHDANGKPFPGAKAYFYDASTGDPIIVHREYSLATPHTNPVEADGNGVFPGVYIDGAETFYRFRVTTAAGIVLSDDAVVPNIGPAEGEGGEPVEPVEVAALAKTGDVKARYGTGVHVGWLACNGQTMGSASSGANSATADNEALFFYLWNADANLAVAGGRGASAAADWAANKRLTLPDMRGRVIAGLDTMGNSAANILPNVDVLGEITGVASATLTVGEIPQMLGSTSSQPAVSIGLRKYGGFGGDALATGMLTDVTRASAGAITPTLTLDTLQLEAAHTHTITLGTASPTAVPRIQPSMGLTFYIKL